jgi:hypothetical protein
MAVELCDLLRLFREQGIRALPFKGPALALRLYGDVALREFGDLDILVPAGQVQRARDLVEARGYDPDHPLAPRWERKALTDRRHYSFSHRHRASGIHLELHWSTDCRAFELPGLDGSWWEARPLVDVSGVPARSLRDEELLYAMCMHAARHRWSRLAWLCDLAELVRSCPALDWERALDLAQRQGTRRLLLLGLDLSRQLLEAPLPEPLARRIADDPGVTVAAGTIARNLGLTTGRSRSLAGRVMDELAWVRFWPPWLGYALGDALLPNMADWSRRDLPPALAALYLPLRVARLLGMAARCLPPRSLPSRCGS